MINIVKLRPVFVENTGKRAFDELSKYSSVMIWGTRPHLHSLCL